MQAHLKDLAANKDTRSFSVCQRVLHRCHEIIFEDSPGLVSGPYSSMKVRSRKHIHRNRVKHHVEPALVGMSCLLAGVPGLPQVAKVVGRVAIEQGREEDVENNIRSLDFQTEDSPIPSPSLQNAEEFGDEEKDDDVRNI